MNTMKAIVGIVCIAGVTLGGTHSVSMNRIIDTRDYKLTVSSAHGTPVPNVGTNLYALGTIVTCSVPSSVIEQVSNWRNTGWTGTGDIPASGTTNTTGFILLETLNSSITWNWVAYYTLTIQTNGVGKVTRTPTSATEVGKIYTLTATAGIGSVFSNWIGAVNNPTNKVTTIVMTSNKTVRANFTDIGRPTVAIIAPTALQKVYGTTGDFTVRGTATDNLALSNVMVKVNSGSFVPASTTTNGLKSWTLPVVLSKGTNTIAAYSVDTTGNNSATVTVKCVYTETGSLTITTNGPGKVTVAPAGPLLLNKTYTLTAAAGAGAVFSNWTVM